MRSATAGEGERELQLTCFHGVKRGITPASGSLAWLGVICRALSRVPVASHDE